MIRSDRNRPAAAPVFQTELIMPESRRGSDYITGQAIITDGGMVFR